MSRRLTILALLLASGGCDPCAGVVGCVVQPHVSVSGRILDEATGAPVRGIPIDFVRTAGVALSRDSIRVSTDGDGLFAFDIDAEAGGSVEGYIRVHPLDSATYRVLDLELPTSTRRGEATVFPPWSTVPHLPDIAELYIRGAGSRPASSMRIDFRRTGGVEIRNLPTGTFTRLSTPAGWVPLFGSELRPVDAGFLVGDITVVLPSPDAPVVSKSIRVYATPVWRPGLTIRRMGVGPSLEYHIAIQRRGQPGTLVPGTEIRFRQTSGIAVTQSDWVNVTDASGRIALPVRALDSGAVIGDVTVIPPSPWKPFTKTGVRFETFEADTAILFAVYDAGPGISAHVAFTAGGQRLKNVAIDFRRTGGVEITPANFSVVTNDSGFAFLTAASQTEGLVTAELTVRPPAPHASFVLRNLQIPVLDGDSAQVTRVLGTWDVTNPPAQRWWP